MQHLFSQWTQISRKLKNKRVGVFLDYDGTLTKIAKKPQQAHLPQGTKNILQKLVAKPRCQVVLVSGRSLQNLKKLVGIDGIIYAGNHGLEFGDLRTVFTIPLSACYKTKLREIKKELSAKLSSVTGVIIEDKKFSLSLHYRLVSKKDVPVVKNTFYNIITEIQGHDDFTILAGKQVLEVTPSIMWNKGNIVLLILMLFRVLFRGSQIVPCYIGDDVTDENAFVALKTQGITVFVGASKKTQANYYLNDVREVKQLLEKINLFLANNK